MSIGEVMMFFLFIYLPFIVYRDINEENYIMSKKSTIVRNKVLNQLVIDVPQGTRTFFLNFGDMLLDDSDMWIVTVYDNPDIGTYGDFKFGIEEHFGLHTWEEKRILTLDNEGWVGRLQTGEANVQAPVILPVHTRTQEEEPVTLEDYEHYVKGAFSAVSALEFQGMIIRSIALPVLVRKGINDLYSEATEILIKYATKFLKQSSNVETIRYYVYHEHQEDAKHWNEAFDRVLGRVFIDASKDGIIESLRKEIITVIESFPKGNDTWDSTLRTLKDSLTNSSGIRPESIGTYGRKLAEIISNDLCTKEHIELDRKLTNNIRKLDENHLLISWFNQYLHTLRIFGNASVHTTEGTKPKYGPKKIQPEDLLVLLASLLRVLKFYKFYLSTKNS